MDRATRATYEERAREWRQRRPPRYAEQAAALSRRCPPGQVRVDLGCGPGGYFPDLGRPLVGLDGAFAMLGIARSRFPEVPLVQADLVGLPFRRNSIGGAWARASYLHLHRSDLPRALADLHRALTVGAGLDMSLRLGVGEGPLPDDDFPGRFFAHWLPEELADVVIGAGFDVQEVAQAGPWLTVRASRVRTLPDFVGLGMRVMVCGLNPSLVAADAGFGYAGATNRFWPAAQQSGLIGRRASRKPLAALMHDGIGMTDLVKRATPRASELSPAEYRQGAARVARLVGWLHPEVVLFVGLSGWRAGVDPGATAGLQPAPFAGAPAYVMPSTSGLNARVGMADLVAHMRAAQSVGLG